MNNNNSKNNNQFKQDTSSYKQRTDQYAQRGGLGDAQREYEARVHASDLNKSESVNQSTQSQTKLDTDQTRLDGGKIRLDDNQTRFDAGRIRFDTNQVRLNADKTRIDTDLHSGHTSGYTSVETQGSKTQSLTGTTSDTRTASTRVRIADPEVAGQARLNAGQARLNAGQARLNAGQVAGPEFRYTPPSARNQARYMDSLGSFTSSSTSKGIRISGLQLQSKVANWEVRGVKGVSHFAANGMLNVLDEAGSGVGITAGTTIRQAMPYARIGKSFVSSVLHVPTNAIQKTASHSLEQNLIRKIQKDGRVKVTGDFKTDVNAYKRILNKDLKDIGMPEVQGNGRELAERANRMNSRLKIASRGKLDSSQIKNAKEIYAKLSEVGVDTSLSGTHVKRSGLVKNIGTVFTRPLFEDGSATSRGLSITKQFYTFASNSVRKVIRTGRNATRLASIATTRTATAALRAGMEHSQKIRNFVGKTKTKTNNVKSYFTRSHVGHVFNRTNEKRKKFANSYLERQKRIKERGRFGIKGRVKDARKAVWKYVKAHSSIARRASKAASKVTHGIVSGIAKVTGGLKTILLGGAAIMMLLLIGSGVITTISAAVASFDFNAASSEEAEENKTYSEKLQEALKDCWEEDYQTMIELTSANGGGKITYEDVIDEEEYAEYAEGVEPFAQSTNSAEVLSMTLIYFDLDFTTTSKDTDIPYADVKKYAQQLYHGSHEITYTTTTSAATSEEVYSNDLTQDTTSICVDDEHEDRASAVNKELEKLPSDMLTKFSNDGYTLVLEKMDDDGKISFENKKITISLSPSHDEIVLYEMGRWYDGSSYTISSGSDFTSAWKEEETSYLKNVYYISDTEKLNHKGAFASVFASYYYSSSSSSALKENCPKLYKIIDDINAEYVKEEDVAVSAPTKQSESTLETFSGTELYDLKGTGEGGDYTECIKKLLPVVLEACEACHVLPSVCIGQIIKESLGDKNTVRLEANNVTGWGYASTKYPESEWDGANSNNRAAFRSVNECVWYYAAALSSENSNYHAATKDMCDAELAITTLAPIYHQETGYETYVDEVLELIDTYNLTQYDAKMSWYDGSTIGDRGDTNTYVTNTDIVYRTYYFSSIFNRELASETPVTALSNFGSYAANIETNQDIYVALRAAGMTHAGACGVMGNLACESAGRTTKNLPDPNEEYGSGSYYYYGIVQWSDERLTNLYTYCAEHNYDSDSLEGQVNFLIYEMEHTGMYSNSWTAVTSASYADDPELMAEVIAANYERCVGNIRGGQISSKAKKLANVKNDVYQDLDCRKECAKEFSEEFDDIKDTWQELMGRYDIVEEALRICSEHWTYSMPNRMGKTSADCSSFVWRVYHNCGYPVPGDWPPTCINMKSEYTKCGFVDVQNSVNINSWDGFEPGDIIVFVDNSQGAREASGHTFLYLGNGQIAEASGRKYGVYAHDIASPSVKKSSSQHLSAVLRYAG